MLRQAAALLAQYPGMKPMTAMKRSVQPVNDSVVHRLSTFSCTGPWS
jgi:hypothetical protein